VFSFKLARAIHENTRNRTNNLPSYRFGLFRGSVAWQADLANQGITEFLYSRLCFSGNPAIIMSRVLETQK
jgi:hypothetical protein